MQKHGLSVRRIESEIHMGGSIGREMIISGVSVVAAVVFGYIEAGKLVEAAMSQQGLWESVRNNPQLIMLAAGMLTAVWLYRINSDVSRDKQEELEKMLQEDKKNCGG